MYVCLPSHKCIGPTDVLHANMYSIEYYMGKKINSDTT